MQNLQKLHTRFLGNGNPAQSITRAILETSDSPEFLLSNLQQVLVAISADFVKHQKAEQQLIDYAFDQNGKFVVDDLHI